MYIYACQQLSAAKGEAGSIHLVSMYDCLPQDLKTMSDFFQLLSLPKARLEALSPSDKTIAMQTWSDLSPTRYEEDQPRLHPQLSVLLVLPIQPEHGPAAPSPPRMTAAADPYLRLRLPRLLPPIQFADVDPEVVYVPRERQDGTQMQHQSGPSPRLQWTLFCTWRDRWGRYCGVPAALLSLMTLFLMIHLFEADSVQLAQAIQNLIAAWLPADAVAPTWLWELLLHTRYI